VSRRTVAVLACLAVLLAGCSQASEAEKVTKATADNLEKIHSGELAFRLVTGAGEPARAEGDVGFEMSGPFALAEPGGLPVARIDYTRLTAGRRASTTVISTGAKAYVTLAGAVYELPAAEVERLRAPRTAKSRGFSSLRIDQWAEDPQLSAGEAVDGEATDRIQGNVDVVRTLNDLFAFGRQVGAEELTVPEIRGEDADQLRRVTSAATVDLLTGREDRFLRRLAVDIRLAAQAPERMKQALGQLAAAHIRLELGVTRVNAPVQVPEPAGALPASALPR
jgi:hypothetical protein